MGCLLRLTSVAPFLLLVRVLRVLRALGLIPGPLWLMSDDLQGETHDDDCDRGCEHPRIRREHDVLVERNEHCAPRGRRFRDAETEKREGDLRDDIGGHGEKEL